MQQRPSHRELAKKLGEGRKALLEKGGLFAEPSKVVTEMMVLGVGDTKEVWSLIADLLEEIRPDHYAGRRPPQKSYEQAILTSAVWIAS